MTPVCILFLYIFFVHFVDVVAYSSCDNLTKHSILEVNNVMFVTVVGDMFHASHTSTAAIQNNIQNLRYITQPT